MIPPPDALIDAVCPSCHCLDARVLGQLGPLVWVRCRACGDDYPLSTSQFTDDPECLVII